MCARVHATILYTSALRLSKYVCTQPSFSLCAHSHPSRLGLHEAASRHTDGRHASTAGGAAAQASKGGTEALPYAIYTGGQYSSRVRAGGHQHQARPGSGRPVCDLRQAGPPAFMSCPPQAGRCSVIKGGAGGGRQGEQGVDGTAAAGLLESISGPASPAGSKQQGTAGLTAATGQEVACRTHHPHSHVKVPPSGESSAGRR